MGPAVKILHFSTDICNCHSVAQATLNRN